MVVLLIFFFFFFKNRKSVWGIYKLLDVGCFSIERSHSVRLTSSQSRCWTETVIFIRSKLTWFYFISKNSWDLWRVVIHTDWLCIPLSSVSDQSRSINFRLWTDFHPLICRLQQEKYKKCLQWNLKKISEFWTKRQMSLNEIMSGGLFIFFTKSSYVNYLTVM